MEMQQKAAQATGSCIPLNHNQLLFPNGRMRLEIKTALVFLDTSVKSHGNDSWGHQKGVLVSHNDNGARTHREHQ